MQKSTILKMSQLPDMLCLLLKTNTDLNQPLLVAIYEAVAGKEEYLSASPACCPVTSVKGWPSLSVPLTCLQGREQLH